MKITIEITTDEKYTNQKNLAALVDMVLEENDLKPQAGFIPYTGADKKKHKVNYQIDVRRGEG